jgi:hypothetical protein
MEQMIVCFEGGQRALIPYQQTKIDGVRLLAHRLCGGEQIANCGGIGAAQFDGLRDGTSELIASRTVTEVEQRDHLASAVLTAQAFDHPLPEQVIARRPSPLRTPLGQRRRACECAWLALQHIEIVFEIEDLLTLAIAAFMPCDTLATGPYLDIGRVGSDHRFRARMQRSRVGAGLDQHAALTIDDREADVGQVEALLRWRKQTFALSSQGASHRLCPAMNGPLFVFDRGGGKPLVQLREVPGAGHRHPVVAAEVADLPFDTALFVSLAGSAEAGGVAPVRPEGDKALCLFAAVSTQDPSHRAGQVVITQRMKDPAKACERQLMSFKKCLLGGTQISTMERCSAVHAAHRKDLQLHSLLAEIGVGFIPVNLRFCRWRIALRNEDVLPGHPQLPLAVADILADPRLAHRKVRTLDLQTLVNPRRSVPLLARCRQVGGQDAIDERHHWP